jgi:hypothetical protein
MVPSSQAAPPVPLFSAGAEEEWHEEAQSNASARVSFLVPEVCKCRLSNIDAAEFICPEKRSP